MACISQLAAAGRPDLALRLVEPELATPDAPLGLRLTGIDLLLAVGRPDEARRRSLHGALVLTVAVKRDGVGVATLQLDRAGRVAQLKGHCNAAPAPATRKACDMYALLHWRTPEAADAAGGAA